MWTRQETSYSKIFKDLITWCFLMSLELKVRQIYIIIFIFDLFQYLNVCILLMGCSIRKKSLTICLTFNYRFIKKPHVIILLYDVSWRVHINKLELLHIIILSTTSKRRNKNDNLLPTKLYRNTCRDSNANCYNQMVNVFL